MYICLGTSYTRNMHVEILKINIQRALTPINLFCASVAAAGVKGKKITILSILIL